MKAAKSKRRHATRCKRQKASDVTDEKKFILRLERFKFDFASYLYNMLYHSRACLYYSICLSQHSKQILQPIPSIHLASHPISQSYNPTKTNHSQIPTPYQR